MKLADKKDGFDWKRMDLKHIIKFCRNNIRYISAGVILVLLVIVLAVTAANRGEQSKDGNGTNQDQEGQTETQIADFEVDAIPEINTLVQNYFAAYAAGDITTLETCAMPISDIEKSYITLMSQYVQEYENIQCHTKRGLNEGEYAVSVVVDMRFEGVEATAPGLDFFYVKQDESGAYYIDNLYSQFNLQNRELELDSQIEEYISTYENQEDMLKLRTDVQTRFEKALETDPLLKTMAEETVPQAIAAWVTEITGAGNQSEEDQTQEETDIQEEVTEEENTPEEQPVDDQTSENDVSAEQTVSEKVYATDNVNIRSEADETSEKVGNAVAGQEFTRTATTDNGWSEVEYNGGKAYIKSEYLSTEAAEQTETGLDYLAEGTTVTVNRGLNVRESMSENAERIGTTEIGDTVKVILSYEEGWTKVEWNGKTGYIKTDLLLNH